MSARTRPTLPEWTPGFFGRGRRRIGRRPAVEPTPNTKLRDAVLDARDASRVSRWLRNHSRGDMPRHIREKMA